MRYLLLIFCLFFFQGIYAQGSVTASSTLDDLFTLDQYSGYTKAIHNDYLLIIGGEVESNIPEADLLYMPNREILLLDWSNDSIIKISLDLFETSISDQLASRDMAYCQSGDSLYIIGGFGYQKEFDHFLCFPSMIIMDIPQFINHVLEGKNLSSTLFQITDEQLSIKSAFLEKLDNYFFLVGGENSYLVPNEHGDYLYYQESYHNEISSFQLQVIENNPQVTDFKIWYHPDDFLNHFEQILPASIIGNGEIKMPENPN